MIIKEYTEPYNYEGKAFYVIEINGFSSIREDLIKLNHFEDECFAVNISAMNISDESVSDFEKVMGILNKLTRKLIVLDDKQHIAVPTVLETLGIPLVNI